MKQDQVVRAIKRLVGDDRRNVWCAANGVNQTVLSDVLRGHKPPTEQLCALVGVERFTVTRYRTNQPAKRKEQA